MDWYTNLFGILLGCTLFINLVACCAQCGQGKLLQIFLVIESNYGILSDFSKEEVLQSFEEMKDVITELQKLIR